MSRLELTHLAEVGTQRRSRATKPTLYADDHARYRRHLETQTALDIRTRNIYSCHVRNYLVWLESVPAPGAHMSDPEMADQLVRDYRTTLEQSNTRKPHAINVTLSAITNFYGWLGLTIRVDRLPIPKDEPQKLTANEVIRWQETVRGWVNPRDRVLGLLPLYAGLHLGQIIALNVHDVHLRPERSSIATAPNRHGVVREIMLHPHLHAELTVWLGTERRKLLGADSSTALLLNHRGNRLGMRGAELILAAIAREAGHPGKFSCHTLRRTFGTVLVREIHAPLTDSGWAPSSGQVAAPHDQHG